MATARKKSFAAPFMAIALCVVVIVAASAFGYGLASANSSSSSAETLGVFNTTSATTSVGQLDAAKDSSQGDENGLSVDGDAHSVYATSTGFDITAAADQLDAKLEAERLAAEAIAAAEEREAIERAYFNKSEWELTDTAGSLESVDWSVGKDAFVKEWSDRIDAYLSGTPLAGYGSVFAEAAWNNGVDPRWSPAISNTESKNGASCFLPHNAWGWGSSSWGSWEEAINAHVEGLANSYGYSLTYACAAKYCPPNTLFWYNNTLAQMQSI